MLAPLLILLGTRLASADSTGITWTQSPGACTIESGDRASEYGRYADYTDEATCGLRCGYNCYGWAFESTHGCVHYSNSRGEIVGGDVWNEAEWGTCNVKTLPAVNYDGEYKAGATGCCEGADGECVELTSNPLFGPRPECEAACNTEFYCLAYMYFEQAKICSLYIGHVGNDRPVQAFGFSVGMTGWYEGMTCHLREEAPAATPAPVDPTPAPVAPVPSPTPAPVQSPTSTPGGDGRWTELAGICNSWEHGQIQVLGSSVEECQQDCLASPDCKGVTVYKHGVTGRVRYCWYSTETVLSTQGGSAGYTCYVSSGPLHVEAPAATPAPVSPPSTPGVTCEDIKDKRQCKQSPNCISSRKKCSTAKACSEITGKKECKSRKNKKRCKVKKTRTEVDGEKVKTSTCVDKVDE